MKLFISAKSDIAKLLGFAGIPEIIIKKQSGNKYLILMYHRILPKDQVKPWIQAGMYVYPHTFEMQVLYLKKHLNVISFSELHDMIINSIPIKKDKPFCIITFDDGWCDFYKYAYPILSKHGIPATVFLPTNYIGTGKIFWTDKIAKLLVTTKQDHKTVNFTGNKIMRNLLTRDMHAEERIENAISFLKNLPDNEIDEIIKEIEKYFCIESVPAERAFLDWDEIRGMAESGVVTYGSHTDGHQILVHLEENEIRKDLHESMDKLTSKKIVDPSFIPFCYPNGSYDERVARIVREVGFHAAVTTEKGWNLLNEQGFNLKRIPIHQDISSSKDMFRCIIANIL